MLDAMAELSNIFWRAFTGSHSHLTQGNEEVRRYSADFPPIVAFRDPSKPDFPALSRYSAPGERFYCGEWSGAEPPGWKIEMDTHMCAMLWKGVAPRAEYPDIVRLGPANVAEMRAIAALTKPGPFAARPMDIGEWYGILDGGKLVAIAGERAHAGELREVSGICTLPEYQGRGYARRLTERVVKSQLDRGLTPFLHVASANARARSLYEHMGFVVDQEIPLRVISLR